MNRKQRKSRRSQLSRRIVLEYLLSLVVFGILFLVFFLAAWSFCNRLIWYESNPLYHILSFVKEYILLFIVVGLMLGYIGITYYFMSKPLRFLDDVVEASGKLITSKESPIELMPEMKNIQDELNLFREQALRSEYAAREAEQRKNDLLVYLAHDLKTPLTSVIGYLTLLQDEPEISTALRSKYTGIALEKAERLEDLINEFFDITRFNLTTLTLEAERTNLTRMMEQIAYEFKPILMEKELTLHTEIDPGVEILCDRDKMERVFDNLIRNAVNYSYSGTEIYLSMKEEDAGVKILVRNHGKTIPKDKLNRIFEQFFRVDSSRATATGGSGLGLAISKEIVELHGGRILAESEKETITFSVFLPYGLS